MNFLVTVFAAWIAVSCVSTAATVYQVIPLDEITGSGGAIGINPTTFGSRRDTFIIREARFPGAQGGDIDLVREVALDGTILWETGPPPGGFVDILPGTRSEPSAAGTVAASVSPPFGTPGLPTFSAYTYNAATGWTSLGIPDSPGATSEGVQVNGINATGQVVGEIEDFGVGLRFTPGLGWEEVPSLAGGTFVSAQAMNNLGAVVGSGNFTNPVGGLSTAPFYSPDLSTIAQAFDEFGQPYQGRATAVNDAGFVTGSFDGQPGLWDTATGDVTILRPGAPGVGRDINNSGMVVGVTFGTLSGNNGFVWSEADGFQFLSEILTEDFWRIRDARQVNEFGDILGNAIDTRTGDGFFVLLRPVPEPEAVLLAVMGGAFLFLLLRRRDRSHPSL